MRKKINDQICLHEKEEREKLCILPYNNNKKATIKTDLS